MILKKIKTMLEMIKFKHTVFALPFAFIGAFLAANGVPDLKTFILVIIAMFGARTCAMAFNRIVDHKFDAANPRTANRAIPAGEVSLSESWLMVVISGLVFFLACWFLNSLTFILAPFALTLTLVYSLTKRFTSLCHVVLGVALAFAPIGGWVAVTGSLEGFPWVLSLGVLFWVAGFDCIYACLDADFDRKTGLHSLPAKLGRKRAFNLAVIFHIIAFILFTITGVLTDLNWIYFIGIAITGAALFYQHFIISPDDLSHIKMSFFSMNGIISITLFIATFLSLLTR